MPAPGSRRRIAARGGAFATMTVGVSRRGQPPPVLQFDSARAARRRGSTKQEVDMPNPVVHWEITVKGRKEGAGVLREPLRLEHHQRQPDKLRLRGYAIGYRHQRGHTACPGGRPPASHPVRRGGRSPGIPRPSGGARRQDVDASNRDTGDSHNRPVRRPGGEYDRAGPVGAASPR